VLAAHQLAAPAVITPPTNLSAVDTPGDDGGSINLSWTLSGDDGAGNGRVDFYEIKRTTTSGSYPDDPIAIVTSGTTSYRDETTTDSVPYFYILIATGDSLRSLPSNETGPVTSEPQTLAVGDASAPVVTPFLSVLGPNPFAIRTELGFGMVAPGPAEIVIYNVAGGTVRRLFSGTISAESQRVTWDGRDARGRAVPGGIYVAMLVSRDLRLSQKLIKLR
ncbi:MAG TPA: FlgD immunoglobulin-like domain containing protein, partial [Candidatus Udaeobacter sp.]|nr:FlgD immunoglobulin-like domain containing protein [Candidatus Udaeobacter sp.]